MTIKGILLDLDDTLYDYVPANKRGTEAVVNAIAQVTAHDPDRVRSALVDARRRVKKRLGPRGSAHARLLYLHELAHDLEPRMLPFVREWTRTFWTAYLDGLVLRTGARAFLSRFRAGGGRVAIVSDLTLDVQLEKIRVLDAFDLIDAIVTSEEVPFDKPAPEAFELALHRLGLGADHCIVIGDNDDKDGAGAKALAMPYYRVGTPERHGPSFDDLAETILS